MRLRRNEFANILPCLLIFALLVACSEGPDQNDPAASNISHVSAGKKSPDASQVPNASNSLKKNNNSVPLEMTALTKADLNSIKLKGELGCSFTVDRSAQPILVAQGDVGSEEPARGIVKVGDTIETIAASGGFDGMLGGATFRGKALELRVSLTGPAQGGGESPARAAKLTANRPNGEMSIYAGVWQCGP